MAPASADASLWLRWSAFEQLPKVEMVVYSTHRWKLRTDLAKKNWGGKPFQLSSELALKDEKRKSWNKLSKSVGWRLPWICADIFHYNVSKTVWPQMRSRLPSYCTGQGAGVERVSTVLLLECPWPPLLGNWITQFAKTQPGWGRVESRCSRGEESRF